MKNLLFLAHRIPYPPNKGDKIRSYHFLKGLAEHYNIHLAAFIDDPEDWDYVDSLKPLTVDSYFEDINPLLAKVKSLSGLLTQKPLTLPYYQSSQFQAWVDKTIVENKIEKIFVFSSAMAQYVKSYQDLDVMIDFVDVDSDKWLQYSKKAKWPMNWVYKREAKYLFKFDSNVAELARMNIFVSEEEASLFYQLTGNEKTIISFVNNGVDTHYFDENEQGENPYPDSKNIITFTGAMDYWANVDAVTWFANEVFPLIKRQCADAQFYIVGSKPTKNVINLAKNEDIFVTGRVEDIRPYLSFSHVIVAPLLIARGIQNKVLEAMSMSKRVVATPQAIEGIKISNPSVSIEETAEFFSKQVLFYLEDSKKSSCASENRHFVEKNFSWNASIKRLIQMID